MVRTHATQKLVDKHPALGLIGNTPIVRLDLFDDELADVQVWAKMEAYNPTGSLKDRSVLRILAEGVMAGQLHAGKTILDASTGNAAISYAMIGRVLGYPVEVVVPASVSAEHRQRLALYGAEVHFTDPARGHDGTITEARRRFESDPDHYFFANQYGNEHNWMSHYDGTAAEIWEALGSQITHFVAGVGTGGSLTGCARRLKAYDSNIQVHCVVPDPFPGIEGLKPLDAPREYVPSVLDEALIDERWPVDEEDASHMNQLLAARGLFVGQSSGAYVDCAYRLARRIQSGCIVTLLNDTGERYWSPPLWED